MKLNQILSRYGNQFCPLFCRILRAFNSNSVQAWEKWRGQVSKLERSAYWVQCGHHQTREGLQKLLKILLGNISNLTSATCHWMELLISHLLYTRPFIMVSLYKYHFLMLCHTFTCFDLVFLPKMNVTNQHAELFDASFSRWHSNFSCQWS